ncbi:hypothetical protein [Galbibacter pacificus]|uniref:Uncharacterized protein n=1 Tax=Galbibacter pacificus TaxID=2996052 RepID=A0ABT6FRU3_9FLAO|nr:hypothetical protein [Galbibacter pacificus]MDG3582894.1 hypothetical protein [Galbibacter pacificus]MDG3585987.1 hypothetical protein [Galbibacter pacificus]
MEIKTKSNGTAKRANGAVKKEVQNKLTNEAIGKIVVSEKKVTVERPVINLDDRIQKFEKCRGLATHREGLTETLKEQTKLITTQMVRVRST